MARLPDRDAQERPLPRSLLIPGLVVAVVVLSVALALLLLAE
jgi:hypothetical protein